MSKLYNEIGHCQICNQQIQDNQSYYHCTGDACYWHQKCMKLEHRIDYEDRLNSGYSSAVPKTYKTTKCQCGSFLHKKTRPTKHVRRMAKVVIPTGLIVGGIAVSPVLILPGFLIGIGVGLVKAAKA